MTKSDAKISTSMTTRPFIDGIEAILIDSIGYSQAILGCKPRSAGNGSAGCLPIFRISERFIVPEIGMSQGSIRQCNSSKHH